MRASVMELLDSFAWDDADVAAEAKRRFDAHWEDSGALPSEYKVQLFNSTVWFLFIIIYVISVVYFIYYIEYNASDYCVSDCVDEWWLG